MAEKKVNKARIIMKHDTEENWLKATNFIPLDSEIIVYDADATNTIPRIKVGDGVTNVNALPFITEELENKVDKVEGKGLSTNDYTDEEAAKVAAAASLNIRNGTRTGSVKTSGATEASGNYSFAEGQGTTAGGNSSHAEGQDTTASGYTSHAEGQVTTASGTNSHAEGIATIAASTSQHAQGKYNIEDTEDNYAHIVGNGTTESERSNAHTLNWDGTAWFQGNVLVGGTGQDDTNAKQLATQEYVNERVPQFTYSTVDLEAGVSPLAEGEVYFVYE